MSATDTSVIKAETSGNNDIADESANGGGGGSGGGSHQPPFRGDRGGDHGPRRGGGGSRFTNRRPHPPNSENPDDRRPRFQRGGPPQGGPDHRNMAERIMIEKLNEICGPTYDLPVLENNERKFSGKSRLYIGNISPDLEEGEVLETFRKYGECTELFINREKNFGFIKMDYHFNAEKVKNELNGTMVKGRLLKIRYAPGSTAVKVTNLDEYVTNEVLHLGFSIFGDVERCVVITDERGKSVGEGIVEFARKNSAQLAIRKCTEGCFFLTSTLRPVYVQTKDVLDDVEGLSEKLLPPKKPQDYYKQRGIGPRFAAPGSFEEEYGMQWKQLRDLYNQKLLSLKKEHEIEEEKLVAQMELARYEHDTEMLRKQLRARELDMEHHKREWKMREERAEENRRRTEEQMRRQEEELQSRILHQEEEMRRRQQENSLFVQAQQLDNILDHQEQAYEHRDVNIPDIASSGGVMDPKAFLNAPYESRFDNRDQSMRGRGTWGPNDSRDYPNKRRRY